MKKVNAEQTNILVVSLHYAVKAPDVSDHTWEDAIKVEGSAVGVCNNSFSLKSEVAPQQIQAGYRTVCLVFFATKKYLHFLCLW